MQVIQRLAEVSVARGFGFGALAITMTMLGFMNNIALGLEMGGVMFLIACMILALQASRAPTRPYKRTEVWIMLVPIERPNAEIAQKIIGTALQETYLRFALHAAAVSIALLVLSVVFRLKG